MAQTETICAPRVIDMDYLESCSFGEDDLILRAIDVLRDQLHDQAADLYRALDSGDWDRLRLIAHSLKSAAGMLGVVDLKERLREIESLSTAGADRGMLARLADEATRLCRLATEDLAEVRQKYAGER